MWPQNFAGDVLYRPGRPWSKTTNYAPRRLGFRVPPAMRRIWSWPHRRTKKRTAAHDQDQVSFDGPCVRAIRTWRQPACRWILSQPRRSGREQLLREGTDAGDRGDRGHGLAGHEGSRSDWRKKAFLLAVVNARFAKPLDTELIIKTAKKVRCLRLVEEGCKMGGFGSAVLKHCQKPGHLRTKILAGLPDWYIEQGAQDLLRERYGLTADGHLQQRQTVVRRQCRGGRCRSPGFTRRQPAAR